MDKREHVGRARSLIEGGDDDALRYAALELRMAMEAIAYAKLKVYAKGIPSSVLARWQPPQLMRALLEFEPRAMSNKRVSFGREPSQGETASPGQLLGEVRSFDLSWLRKTYNKLGSLLHLEFSVDQAKPLQPPALRADLIKVLDEVNRVAQGTLEGGFATVVTFNCAACDTPTHFNEESARQSNRAKCLSCTAEHTVEFNASGEALMHLIATDFECLSCQSPTTIEHRHLEIGFTFACKACGAKHVFAEKHWGYALRPAVAADGA